MSRSALARFDWPGWRADVVERLDRRSVSAGLAYAAALAVLINANGSMDDWRDEVVNDALQALFCFSMVMVTLAAMAVALVAVARGISVWVAYPAAGIAAVALGSVVNLPIDYFWLPYHPKATQLWVFAANTVFLLNLGPAAVLYVYASSATHDAKVLRAVEAERAAEAERVAQQRLQTELATVDHDLVLRAMRLALAVWAREAAQAEALLEAVTAYLRLAQQRGSSEPDRIAVALAELRQACAIYGGEPSQRVMA
jgi:hypothetical protein